MQAGEKWVQYFFRTRTENSGENPLDTFDWLERLFDFVLQIYPTVVGLLLAYDTVIPYTSLQTEIWKRSGYMSLSKRLSMSKNDKYRVTRISKIGTRQISMMDANEIKLFRAQRLKELRKTELGLTQKDLAQAIGVNLRTLQDWELGRNPLPKPVEILMELMKEMPSVKKRLLAEI
ncbi:MAG TPA: helix-turn-helix transcriptional regulator [Bacteroidota bacterium]|nr:helix-turn-helix transcriptional regulator [Bacteroidota bacterium]